MSQPEIRISRDPQHCLACASSTGFHVKIEAVDTKLTLMVWPPGMNKPAIIGGCYDLGVPDAVSGAVITRLFAAAADVAAGLDAAAGMSGRRYRASKTNRW